MKRIKDGLDSRSFDELVEASERLASADNDLRWALIEARKRAGYTQRELAEILGVSQPTIANFERQENDPRLSTLRRYALAVGAEIRHQVRISDGTVFGTAAWGGSAWSAPSLIRSAVTGVGRPASGLQAEVLAFQGAIARDEYVMAA